MAPKETPITSTFLGFVKKAPCPNCGAVLTRSPAGFSLCSKCGDYAEFGERTARPLAPEAKGFEYFAPTPWTDMENSIVGAVLRLDPANAILDSLRAKKTEGRVLDARWPAECCVCGAPATRSETISAQVEYQEAKAATAMRPILRTRVAASGVPHCAAHENGARFARVSDFGDRRHRGELGLAFRSHGGQLRFRKLNPWSWAG
jgi:hypothetical protein